MRFFKIYGRVLRSLGNDKRLAIMLGVANVIVAGLQFLDPVVRRTEMRETLGRVIGLLTQSDRVAPDELWLMAAQLLGIWFAVGLASIAANIGTALHAERMAHRNRLSIMNRYFGHVLSLPLSFHGDIH